MVLFGVPDIVDKSVTTKAEQETKQNRDDIDVA